jgi:non-ribosomal peptide synthetase component F
MTASLAADLLAFGAAARKEWRILRRYPAALLAFLTFDDEADSTQTHDMKASGTHTSARASERNTSAPRHTLHDFFGRMVIHTSDRTIAIGGVVLRGEANFRPPRAEVLAALASALHEGTQPK